VNAMLVGLLGSALGAVCVGLAVLFAFLWPSKVAADGIARTVLRWGHSAVWALLALWLFQSAWMPEASGIGSLLPLVAGLAYVAFIVTLITASRRRTR
jgi:uncharacterized membrane protein